MALLATNRFAGDGVTTSYEINFVGKYLDKSHVFAYVEDDATGDRTPVTIAAANWLNDTTLQSLPVVPVGKTMVIYRNTPALPLVDFVDGAWLTPKALDTATRQGLFKAVESADGADGGGGGGGGPVVWADIQGKPYASSSVPGIFKVGAGLTMSPDGVLSSSGGTGGGSPTGPAGGVLAGAYPNPTFAVPMATQSELDGKAAVVHTHSLAQLTQSGAATGQVPAWDGTKWAPVNQSSGGGGPATPTGPAGGDLDGEYPNPVFRVPMATADELENLTAMLSEGLGAKAPAVHTHSPNQITQAGAASGQVLMWNGSAWAPQNLPSGGGGGGGGQFTACYKLASAFALNPAVVDIGWSLAGAEATGVTFAASGIYPRTTGSAANNALQSVARPAGWFHIQAQIVVAGVTSGQYIRIVRYDGETSTTPVATALGNVMYVPTGGNTAVLNIDWRVRAPAYSIGFGIQGQTLTGSAAGITSGEHGGYCYFSVTYIPD